MLFSASKLHRSTRDVPPCAARLKMFNILPDQTSSIEAELTLVFCAGDTKSEETANKEAGEEKPEEDNDYHRSDEQVSPCFFVKKSRKLCFAFGLPK